MWTWTCWDNFRRGCVAPPSGHPELFPTECKQALSFIFLAVQVMTDVQQGEVIHPPAQGRAQF